MNTCIGCGSCQVACKDSHNLLPDEYFRRAGMRSMRIGKEPRLVPFSISCNHCERPACVAACPTESLHFGEYPPESGALPDLPFLPDPSLTEPSLRIRKPDVLRKENEDGAVR